MQPTSVLPPVKPLPWIISGICRALVSLAVVIVGGSVALTPASAQYKHSKTLISPNPQSFGDFGRKVTGIGDIDGGEHEYIIGAPGESVRGSVGAGRAYVFESTGELLQAFKSPNSEEFGRFGAALTGIDDLDGDGVGEVLISARNETVRDSGAGRAYVFSRGDGALLQAFESPNSQEGGRFGEDVAEIGDVDGDGTPDILIGAPKEEVKGSAEAGRAYIFSGADGDLIEALAPPNGQPEGGFGWAVDRIGDVNEDDIPDLIISAPGESVSGTEDAGRVYLISGADGDVLDTLRASTPFPRDFFGSDVSSVTDVNGDGVPDVIVGASKKTILGVDASTPGQAYVFSGSDGKLLRTIAPPNAQRDGCFGCAVEGIDADGDGAGDVLVGAPSEDVSGVRAAGRAYTISGQGGQASPLQTLESNFEVATFGYSVANGSGLGLAVGAPLEDARGVNGAGRVHLYKSVGPFRDAYKRLQAAKKFTEQGSSESGEQIQEEQKDDRAERVMKNEEENTLRVDNQIPETKMDRPSDIAVVIGNKKYKHTDIPDVKYAARDAQVVKKYLIRTLGFREKNVIYVENASASAMARIFGTESSPDGQLYDWVKSNQSDVFVYYSGHGAPSPESGDAYFIPTDINPSYLSQNGYPVNQLYENLAHLPASSVTVVLEACFSGVSEAGAVIPEISPAVLSVENPIMRLENGLAFTAGAADQVSTWYSEKKHGLFTYYFLKGLRGAANSNDDRAITARELEVYLAEEVPYRARRLHSREQTPQVVGQDKGRTLVRYEKEIPANRR